MSCLALLVNCNYIFKFQPNVCSRCHDLLMSIKLSNIADHHCMISLISKNEAIKLLQNADLTQKSENL